MQRIFGIWGSMSGRPWSCLLPNELLNVVVAAAAWRLGAFVVPLNCSAPDSELASQLEVIASRNTRVTVVGQPSDRERPFDAIDVAALSKTPDGQPVPAIYRSPSRAICSGGTTGRPKLIVDESPWGWSGEEPILDQIGWADARRVLIYSPLYHNVGASLTHRALMGGKCVYLMERFSAQLAAEIIRDESIEFFFAVPTHMHRMLTVPGIDRSYFDGVLGMYHSGAACAPALKRKWISLVGAKRVWEIYGATDGSGFTVIRADEWLEHPGSVGKPVGSDILILDDEGRDAPTGTVGSIYMAPTQVPGHGRDSSFSYIGAELPPLVRDRFRTAGDLGWLDDEGYLYIADRRTDMIITGGANVYPAEIEAVLADHPDVDEVAVIGIPDPEWGHRVHAIVKSKNSAALDESGLGEFCRARLAPYKRPKSYEFVTDLPRTEVGKISRVQLARERAVRESGATSRVEGRR